MPKKPDSCAGCPLHKLGKGFAQPDGQAKRRLLVVAEALGDNEARDSLPLRPYAQAGSIFERALMSLKLTRGDVVIQNVVNCQPPGNVLEGAWYKYQAISHCKPNLDKVVEEYKPTAILALGGVPLESLTGLKGKKKNISSLRGYVLWNETYKLPMISTYHPSFIARGNKNLLGVFYYDILRAVQLAEGKLVEGRDYYLNPMGDYPNEYTFTQDHKTWMDYWDMLRANPDLPLAFDIETADSINEESEDDIESNSTKVTQYQISHKKGQAMVLERGNMEDNQFFGLISNFMSLPNPKLSWNGWRFDQPILESYGVNIKEPHYDLMTMFHFSEPDLPAGLQFAASMFRFPFAWKHLAGDSLPFYGAADVDSLHWIYEALVGKMKREGVYGE